MTAEIAIANKSAVALAADSLVTIERSADLPAKTYIANKLFSLSKHHPIGIMVFGAAEIMQIPWETVIKVYRKELGKRSYSTVEQQAEDFFEFLGSADYLFPDDVQRRWFSWCINWYLRIVNDAIDEAVKNAIQHDGKIAEGKITQIVQEVASARRDWLFGKKLRDHLTDDFPVRIAEEFSTEIDDAISRQLEKKPISAASRGLLRECAARIVATKQVETPHKSGVVIAGFGARDVFPKVLAYNVYGVVSKTAIFDFDDDDSFADSGAAVLPFAQRDVVDTFLGGINGRDRRLIDEYLEQVFSRLPTIIAESAVIEQTQKPVIVDTLRSATSDAVEKFAERFAELLRKRHVEPLLSIVSVLPKDELANLAEALVSLTSMKRKVSLETETVGGPIDVAVISKGDGFIWIRRKHYFDSKLNHAFLETYFER